MGNNIRSQEIVQTLTVRGRVFRIERTVWTNADGLSFDVHDAETGLCLTAESFDDWPGRDNIADLLDRLDGDLDHGTLDFFFQGAVAELRRVLGR